MRLYALLLAACCLTACESPNSGESNASFAALTALMIPAVVVATPVMAAKESLTGANEAEREIKLEFKKDVTDEQLQKMLPSVEGTYTLWRYIPDRGFMERMRTGTLGNLRWHGIKDRVPQDAKRISYFLLPKGEGLECSSVTRCNGLLVASVTIENQKP